MLKKNYSKTGTSCRVTFKLPADVGAKNVALLGEFNEWSQEAHPMKKLKNGSFSATLSVEVGQEYRYRYLLDDGRWINDEAPDQLVPNRFGGQDCLLAV